MAVIISLATPLTVSCSVSIAMAVAFPLAFSVAMVRVVATWRAGLHVAPVFFTDYCRTRVSPQYSYGIEKIRNIVFV
eukprot:IDg7189t1